MLPDHDHAVFRGLVDYRDDRGGPDYQLPEDAQSCQGYAGGGIRFLQRGVSAAFRDPGVPAAVPADGNGSLPGEHRDHFRCGMVHFLLYRHVEGLPEDAEKG